MPSFRVTGEAELDLIDIADRGITLFGARQAYRYNASLEGTFDLLSRFPYIGLKSFKLRPGLYRYPLIAHIIFIRSKTIT